MHHGWFILIFVLSWWGRIHELSIEVLNGWIHSVCFKVNIKMSINFAMTFGQTLTGRGFHHGWCKGHIYLGSDQGWKGGIGKSVCARMERWRSGKRVEELSEKSGAPGRVFVWAHSVGANMAVVWTPAHPAQVFFRFAEIRMCRSLMDGVIGHTVSGQHGPYVYGRYDGRHWRWP